MLKIPRYDIWSIAKESEGGNYCRWEDVEKALAEKDAAYNTLAEQARQLVIDAARPFTGAGK